MPAVMCCIFIILINMILLHLLLFKLCVLNRIYLFNSFDLEVSVSYTWNHIYISNCITVKTVGTLGSCKRIVHILE